VHDGRETFAEHSILSPSRLKKIFAIKRKINKPLIKREINTAPSDDIVSLNAKPVSAWEKAVELQVYGRDRHGVHKPFEKRGSGIRRLLMVAFFEHLAEKGGEKKKRCIFGIEEPENNLHPGLQRDLVSSFRKLADQGHQIIITTHSPVFAGSSPVEDLAQIVRERGKSKAIQLPELNLYDVACELGVEPSDQIMGYNACVLDEHRGFAEIDSQIRARCRQ
jgi:hypothetical protein